MARKKEPSRHLKFTSPTHVRQTVPAWWIQITLLIEDVEIVSDAVLDSGSAHTIVPRQIVDQVVDLSGLPFDGPKISTAFGVSRTTPVFSEICITTEGGRTKRAPISVHVTEESFEGFGFVVVGLNALDRLKAKMVFGEGSRRLSGPDIQMIVPDVTIRMISPVSERE